eukprot:tig00000241_g21031.t1
MAEILAGGAGARVEFTHSVLTGDGLGRLETLQANMTLGRLRDRLYAIFGTKPDHQKLQIKSSDGAVLRTIAPEDDGAIPVSALNVQDGMRIHVVDVDPTGALAALTDVSRVEKYTMSEGDYDKRTDNFRKWKEKNMQKPAAGESSDAGADKATNAADVAEKIKVGDRCMVQGDFPRKGTVKFVGDVKFSAGVWVGVQLDEPSGKNDGSVKDVRYFECPPKYGVFVQPDKVQVGDFPEDELGDDDEL